MKKTERAEKQLKRTEKQPKRAEDQPKGTEKQSGSVLRKNRKKRTKIILAAAAVAALGLGGSTMAYLTDVERTTNHFQVGKVDIQLTEPSWVEADNQQIEASGIIKKDPQITNVGINDAFVYMEVQIPTASIVTTDAAGVRENEGVAKEQELFAFTPDTTWSLVKKAPINGKMVYTYAYNKILAKTENTEPLFRELTFANIVEGQIDENEYDVPVAAFAIQTEHTGDDGADVPAQARAAYEKYANQNLGKTGAVQVSADE